MRKTVMCPEDCSYRNRYAPFCGYCLKRIIEEQRLRKEEKRNGQEVKAKGHQ